MLEVPLRSLPSWGSASALALKQKSAVARKADQRWFINVLMRQEMGSDTSGPEGQAGTFVARGCCKTPRTLTLRGGCETSSQRTADLGAVSQRSCSSGRHLWASCAGVQPALHPCTCTGTCLSFLMLSDIAYSVLGASPMAAGPAEPDLPANPGSWSLQRWWGGPAPVGLGPSSQPPMRVLSPSPVSGQAAHQEQSDKVTKRCQAAAGCQHVRCGHVLPSHYPGNYIGDASWVCGYQRTNQARPPT